MKFEFLNLPASVIVVGETKWWEKIQINEKNKNGQESREKAKPIKIHSDNYMQMEFRPLQAQL